MAPKYIAQMKNWGWIKWFKIGKKERYPVFNKLFWPDWWMQSGKGGGGKTRTCWSNGPGWYHALTILMLLWHWSSFISQVLCSGRAPQRLLTLGTAQHVPQSTGCPEQGPGEVGMQGCSSTHTSGLEDKELLKPSELQLTPQSIPFLSWHGLKNNYHTTCLPFYLLCKTGGAALSPSHLSALSMQHNGLSVQGGSAPACATPLPSADTHSLLVLHGQHTSVGQRKGILGGSPQLENGAEHSSAHKLSQGKSSRMCQKAAQGLGWMERECLEQCPAKAMKSFK